MHAKRIIASTVAAAFLALAAACGVDSPPTPTPTQTPGKPLTCAEGRGNEGIVLLSPLPQNESRLVMFDLSSFVAPGFPTTYKQKWNEGGQMKTYVKGSPDKATIFCDNVISLDDYVIVQGHGGSFVEEDRVFGAFPNSIAYVFRKSASSPSGLGFVGAAPDFVGDNTYYGGIDEKKRILVVKNYENLGDLLVVASNLGYARRHAAGNYYNENNLMLDAIARALGFEDFQNASSDSNKRVAWVNGVAISSEQDMSTEAIIEKALELKLTGLSLDTEIRIEETYSSFQLNSGVKIAIYRLPEQTTPYDPAVRLQPLILEKIAARPLVFGKNAELGRMELVRQGGEPHLELAATVYGRGTVTEYVVSRLSDALQGSSLQIVKKEEVEEGSTYISPKTVALKEILEKGITPAEPLLR